MNYVEFFEDNINFFKDKIDEFFKRNEKDYEFFHPHKFSYFSLLNEVLQHDKDYYVFLMDNDNVVGYGLLRGWQEGYEIPSLGIMIDVDFRGKGFSSQMMQHLHEIAKTKGSDKIRLTVYKENKTAICLYNKLGYEFSDKNENELVGIKNL